MVFLFFPLSFLSLCNSNSLAPFTHQPNRGATQHHHHIHRLYSSIPHPSFHPSPFLLYISPPSPLPPAYHRPNAYTFTHARTTRPAPSSTTLVNKSPNRIRCVCQHAAGAADDHRHRLALAAHAVLRLRVERAAARAGEADVCVCMCAGGNVRGVLRGFGEGGGKFYAACWCLVEFLVESMGAAR